MTLRERVEEDGIGMRWFRTAATTITSIVGALLVIWMGLLWLVEPRFYDWADQLIDASTKHMAKELEQTTLHLDRLDEVVTKLEENVIALTEASERNTAPSWRFDPVETRISDGPIGGTVTITAAGYKLRDCGVPVIDLYFINGKQTYHRFVDASILTANNRGVSLTPAPNRLQRLTYTAEIPAEDNVTAGRGHGYIAVTYPSQCPFVEPAVVGPLQFRILPKMSGGR